MRSQACHRFPALALALVLVPACMTSDEDDDDDDDVVDAAAVDAPPPLPDAPPPPPDAPPHFDAQPYNCAALPPGPFTLSTVPNAIASEDLAFDAEGRLVGSDDSTIFRTPFGGTPEVFVPSFNFRAGMRFLPNGHLMVANDQRGELVRVDPDGVKWVILSGLAYPNGLAVDLKGYVYVSEHDAHRVRRVDPMTGSFTVVIDGQIEYPNGLTFNNAYDTLYIDGFSGVGTVYALHINVDGTPGALTEFVTGLGSGYLDGMGVDACGNLYVCDYTAEGATQVFRISPDGTERTIIIESEYSGEYGVRYLPNLDWGSGIGGWDTHTIYIPNGWEHSVYYVDIGVPAKRRPYPPEETTP